MDRAALLAQLQNFDPATITDPVARPVVLVCLNLVARDAEHIDALTAEVARLKDEIARLKGEQGRPKFPPKRDPGAGGTGSEPKNPGDHSSEQERQQREPRKPWQKSAKLPAIHIDRTQVVRLERSGLPADLKFKGYEDTVVQDVVLRTDNVRFRRQIWHSASAGKSYLAPLPPGYDGEFGPGLRALVPQLKYEAHVTLPLIHRLLTSLPIFISRGQVSNLATLGLEEFHAEAAAVQAAGLRSAPWAQHDVTGTRVDGKNHACHIVCGPLFTSYRTLPQQDRLSILRALQGGAPLHYRLDATALELAGELGVAQWARERLTACYEASRQATPPGPREWDEAAFPAWLDRRLPTLGAQSRRWVEEALAIAAYRADRAPSGHGPALACLLTDDAAAARHLTPEQALCWVHDGRHYTKLNPPFVSFRAEIAAFRTRYWDYYGELLAYQAAPSAAEAVRLEEKFDRLFATTVGYVGLAECLARTRGNKAKLLRVLRHPELPLHNNAAELAARRRVRKRAVSFGPRSPAGLQAWDTFQTLLETTRKLGIGFGHYLRDRFGQRGEIAPLAEIIRARGDACRLGASWDTS
jgi:hypothetical protein